MDNIFLKYGTFETFCGIFIISQASRLRVLCIFIFCYAVVEKTFSLLFVQWYRHVDDIIETIAMIKPSIRV